jgi:hypothetical protein
MLEEAWRLYAQGALSDRPVRLIGIRLSELGSAEEAQLDLFDQGTTTPRRHRIYETLDDINARFGPRALQWGLSPRRDGEPRKAEKGAQLPKGDPAGGRREDPLEPDRPAGGRGSDRR